MMSHTHHTSLFALVLTSLLSTPLAFANPPPLKPQAFYILSHAKLYERACNRSRGCADTESGARGVGAPPRDEASHVSGCADGNADDCFHAADYVFSRKWETTEHLLTIFEARIVAFETIEAPFIDIAEPFEGYPGSETGLDTMLDPLMKALDDRRQVAERDFDERIRKIEVQEARARAEAISAFEGFLTRAPKHPRFAAEARYHLGLLEWEAANMAYLDADERYMHALDRYDQGLIPAPPLEPRRDHRRTIAHLEALRRDAPDYLHLDAATYLLGLCHLHADNLKAARETFTEIPARWPESRLIQEIELRLAESHFDDGDFKAAAALYERALSGKDLRLGTIARYKLAFCHLYLGERRQAKAHFTIIARCKGVACPAALREEASALLEEALAAD